MWARAAQCFMSCRTIYIQLLVAIYSWHMHAWECTHRAVMCCCILSRIDIIRYKQRMALPTVRESRVNKTYTHKFYGMKTVTHSPGQRPPLHHYFQHPRPTTRSSADLTILHQKTKQSYNRPHPKRTYVSHTQGCGRMHPGNQAGYHPVPAHTERRNPSKVWTQRLPRSPQ